MKKIILALALCALLSGCTDYEAQGDIEDLEVRVAELEGEQLTHVLSYEVKEAEARLWPPGKEVYIGYRLWMENGFSEPVLFAGSFYSEEQYEEFIEMCDFYDFPKYIDTGQEVEYDFTCAFSCEDDFPIYRMGLEFKFADANVPVEKFYGKNWWAHSYDSFVIELDDIRERYMDVCLE